MIWDLSDSPLPKNIEKTWLLKQGDHVTCSHSKAGEFSKLNSFSASRSIPLHHRLLFHYLSISFSFINCELNSSPHCPFMLTANVKFCQACVCHQCNTDRIHTIVPNSIRCDSFTFVLKLQFLFLFELMNKPLKLRIVSVVLFWRIRERVVAPTAVILFPVQQTNGLTWHHHLTKSSSLTFQGKSREWYAWTGHHRRLWQIRGHA